MKGAAEDDLLKLTRLGLVDALKASARVHKLGVSLQVAINLSVENLLQLPIADLVLLHRPEYDNWAGLLLEVSERQVVNKIENLKVRLPRLLKSGASLAIDNYGRGSANLHMLTQIPVSEIKLDRSLVENCATNVGNANICKTFIQMALNFGVQATAVGISTRADLQTLSELGCDFGQGFLLGKPMSAQGIDEWIQQFKNRVG